MKSRKLTWRQRLGIALLLLIAAAGLALDAGWRWRDVTAILTPQSWGPDARAPEQGEDPAALSACQRRFIEREGVSATSLNDFSTERGCGYDQGVRIKQIGGLRFGRSIILNCPLAEDLAKWVERDLKPLGPAILGSELVGLEHLGGYNCRTIAGRRRLSEHSFGNAIDLAAVRLADGRLLPLLGNWSPSANQAAEDEDGSVRRFWRTAAKRACRRFDVVLTPAYNAAHADHFHFDNGPFNSCRI